MAINQAASEMMNYINTYDYCHKCHYNVHLILIFIQNSSLWQNRIKAQRNMSIFLERAKQMAMNQ